MKINIELHDYGGGFWEIVSPGKSYVYVNSYMYNNVNWNIVEGTNKTKFWKRYRMRFG
jgi:hypothetical protein